VTRDLLAMSLAWVALGLVVVGAYADDVPMFQPDWRGQEGTTYQQWTFLDNDNPAAPEVISNDYGDAWADITVKENGAGWQDYLITAPDRRGVWVDLDSIVLEIANRPDPLDYKEIWLQVTYYEGSAVPPEITVPGATFLDMVTEDVGPTDPTGASWIVQHSRWLIEPNPASETIILAPPQTAFFGITIDQIVVDTICIPEPATALLLVGGILGGALRLRHRR